MGQKTLITDEVRELIKEVAQETAAACFDAAKSEVNYYKVMEALLNNYTKLCDLVAHEEDYLKVELQSKSKSIAAFNPTAPVYSGIKTDEEIIEELQKQKAIQFYKTKARFDEVDRVIKLFENRKEFPIIRMYYFNEDPQGNRRDGEEKYTFEEIAEIMGDMGLLKDERTARRWRSRIVSDMAVCMFGKSAAVNAGKTKILKEV